MRSGRPALTLTFAGGIGDQLLCTVVAHEAARRGVGPIWMVTPVPEFFRGNPDVAEVISTALGQIKVHQFVSRQWCCPLYTKPEQPLDLDRDEIPTAHILELMCKKAGLSGEIILRPYLHLDADERARGRLMERQIVIHSGRLAMPNKNWYFEGFQKVANGLSKIGNVIQIGTFQDQPLAGVIDLRGKLSLRETAALLNNALVFVGQVGMTMHLARAVECRAAIIYGGREHPKQSGYSANENLFADIPCAPCWQYSRCEYERVCMRQISADDVITAAARQISLHGVPLVEDRGLIPN